MNWSDLWLPVIITAFAWWFSTGLILIVVRLPRATHGLLLVGFAAFALLAGWGILASSQSQTPATVYCGFVCALVIWGWHEASFLMGKITGPRPQACPAGVTGWHRFGYATATLIYHEVALFLTLLALGVLTWDAPNQIALWTFGLLFAMRLSAKFNIFLGVPNLTEEFFPLHLEHLKSYLPKRTMNPLMPVSILASLAMVFWLSRQLTQLDSQTGAFSAFVIVLTLTCLGILEHLFMITPLPDAALWRWATRVRPTAVSNGERISPVGTVDLTKSDNG